jgi:hypothetical protein
MKSIGKIIVQSKLGRVAYLATSRRTNEESAKVRDEVAVKFRDSL